jgi:dolichol-phosphate mannosyltransferase
MKMSNQNPNVMVILPTYNEAENLPILIPLLLDMAPLRVLVVDDNSPDGTGKIADRLSSQNPNIQVLHRKGVPRGLGAAYIDGFQQALKEDVDIIIGMDADLSHDPAYIPVMLEMISHYDMIIGSRYAPGGGVDGPWGWYRFLLSHGAQLYIRLMLGLRARDATSAFRCVRRAVLEQLNMDSMDPAGFSFLIELVYHVEHLGFKVGEIPIRFRDREHGISKVSSKVIASALLRVLEIRLKSGRTHKKATENIKPHLPRDLC